MSWTTDYLDPEYSINPGDLAILWDATYQRVRLRSDLMGDAFDYDASGWYPLGITPEGTDLQSWRLYYLLDNYICQIFGAQAPNDDYVMRPGATIAGVASTGIFVADYEAAIDPLIFKSIGAARDAAGLTTYDAAYDSTALRRRCPRIVFTFDFVPTYPYTHDNEGNAYATGQKAWECFGTSMVDPFFHYTGRLLEKTATGWKFIGQANGDMPDLLDSESGAPLHAIPGLHKKGDYIDGIYMHERRELLKLVRKTIIRALPVNLPGAPGQTKKSEAIPFGLDGADADYGVAKTESETLYSGFTPLDHVSVEKPMQAAMTYYDGSSYMTSLESRTSRFTAIAENPFNRAIKFFGAAISPFSPIPGSFHANGTPLVENVYTEFQSFGAGASDRQFNSDLINDLSTPAWPVAPPADSTFRYHGWWLEWAVMERDYAVAGGLTYT